MAASYKPDVEAIAFVMGICVLRLNQEVTDAPDAHERDWNLLSEGGEASGEGTERAGELVTVGTGFCTQGISI